MQTGETVTYQYDSLNRLASATSSVNPGWGQSFGYDGFGNLTNVNVTKGTAPTLNVAYNAATNRRTTDCADANGNIGPCGANTYSYDVANRITKIPTGNWQTEYSYAPNNQRIWKGTWSDSTTLNEEFTFYSAGGAKLASYTFTAVGFSWKPTSIGYYEYFGGKLLKNAQGWVNQDRLGSLGKFFPYGQERPSATTNGTEKFATYFRDAETGLDYAQNRYHSAGEGRFLTPDPYHGSADVRDPGSWNRYAYAGGDPVNRSDPTGLDYQSFMVNQMGCFWGFIESLGYDWICNEMSVFRNDMGQINLQNFLQFSSAYGVGGIGWGNTPGADGGDVCNYNGEFMSCSEAQQLAFGFQQQGSLEIGARQLESCLRAIGELVSAAANVSLRSAEAVADVRMIRSRRGGKLDPTHIKSLKQALKQMENAQADVEQKCRDLGPGPGGATAAASALAAALAAAAAAAAEAAPWLVP